jgi:hypothetical protein
MLVLLTGSSIGTFPLLGNYTDELKFYGDPQNGTTAFYNQLTNCLQFRYTKGYGIWFRQIYATNAVIRGIKQICYFIGCSWRQLKAKLSLYRALLHFYLTNLFDDIPYIALQLTTNKIVLVKSTPSLVYVSTKKIWNKPLQLLPDSTCLRPLRLIDLLLMHYCLKELNLYAGLWDRNI